MKMTKRILSLVLCFVMLVGLMPAITLNAEAAGEPIDAAVIFSDLHTNWSDDKQSTVTGIMNAVSGLPVSSVTGAGDMFSVNEYGFTYDSTANITSYIRSELGDIPVNYVWSDHDRRATDISKESGFVYGAGSDGVYGTADDGNYYVYALSMADIGTNDRYNAGFSSDAEVTAAISDFTSGAAELDQTKPLFVVSHMPLLDRRDDNGHAYEWATAINEIAQSMDVAFFFGHNHRHDVEKDYYYGKGETMSVCSDSNGNAMDVVLNFSHICAGYMDPSSTGSTSNTTRQGVAVAITIYADSINYTTYDANGVYTGSYALNETVERAFAKTETEPTVPETSEPSVPETSEPSVPETSEPTVPETSEPTVPETSEPTVPETSEPTVPETSEPTVPETSEPTVPETSEPTMPETSEPTEPETSEPTEPETSEPTVPETSEPTEPEIVEKTDEASGVTVAAPGITDVAVNVVTDPIYDTKAYSAYASFDITVEGHVDGVQATVTLPAPAGFDAEKPVVILYEGEVVATTSIVEGKISFTTDHFSTYDTAQVAEDNLEWIEVSTAQDKTIFRLTNSLEAGKKYVIVNRNAAGNGNAITRNSSSSAGTVGVTVIADAAGNYIEAPATTAQWTFDSSSKLQSVSNSGNYLFASANNSFDVDDSSSTNYTTWSYSTSNGLRARRSSYSTSYRNCNNYSIYVEEKLQSDPMWAALDGQTSFTFHVGAYNVDAIRNAISVYTATDANGTGKTPTNDYQLVGAVSGGTAGTYELSVQYGGKELGKISVVISSDPYLKITENDKETELIFKKNVLVNDTVQLGVKAFNGTSLEGNPNVAWEIPEEYDGMASVDGTGKVTFKVDRANFLVKATWTVGDKTLTDTIQIIITPDNYLTPGTSTNDFPEYPNQGAVRYDKTAEAVGNFSETGVTQLELSMTGIPFSAPKTLDVVLMLDHSNSMTEARMAATRAAVEVFVNNIVKNADGSFNGNRIYIGSFAGGNPEYAGQSRHEFRIYQMTTEEEDGFQIVNDQDELDALIAEINSTYVKFSSSTAPYGTEYDQSLEDCYNVLSAVKSDGHQQFCVFMSDGIPNVYRYGAGTNDTTTSSSAMANLFTPTTGTTGNRYTSRGTNYKYEYWSSLMKQEGVTVFSVGLGLHGTNSSLNGANEDECERVSNMLLNDISGPAGETAADRDTGNAVTKKDKYFFSVADANAAEDMENVFTNIASQIMMAATDIVVTDKIANEYHMIFGVPKSIGNDEKAAERNAAVAAALENQDLYIEVVNYTLDAQHERTGDPAILTRIYLKDSNGATAGGTYSAATDANGTAAPAPTFTAKTEGKRGYWAEFTGTAGEDDIVITVNGTNWKFMEKGDGTHNVTAGAYAYGTIDEQTNMSNDLVIVTPYFAYSASTKMLSWTADKVEEFKELALRYFLYLDASSTEIGTTNETPAGTYKTNEWAYITYTNHLGNDCRQEFPVPQMTWNGAQVSYVFYLVNEQGQPINKAGELVDFANATFITDIFTESVVWNDTDTPTEEIEGEIEGVAYLDAQWKAGEKLPEGYSLYDTEAYYELKVYEDHEGNVLDNYFMITGSEKNGNTVSTTKVYNTKAGTKYSAYGTYNKDNVASGFDFANTTVAFAVVWKLQLNPDTVVVDYGLDVLVNVVENDLIANTLTGISKTERTNLDMNTAIAGNPAFGSQTLDYTDYVFSVEGENQIRFHQKNMQFKEPVTIYYETKSTDYINGTARTGYMYSSLTIIPATTIYYEDSFLTLESYAVTYSEDGTSNSTKHSKEECKWTQEGTSISNVQQQDRPGESEISAALDADNNYGYDAAYKNMATHSMGSAAKIDVTSSVRGEATFTFHGTGFDVISTTSNATGTLIVQLYKGASATGKAAKTLIVDTYYSYVQNAEGEWVVSNTGENALYQVPVMQMNGLTYGQYTVKIVAGYNSHFDHNDTKAGYTLYLDAIRIYDPTGNQNDVANDAYVDDGEGFPIYKELRNLIIEAESFGTYLTVDTEDASKDVKVDGIVFIDGDAETSDIANYTGFGPNNELYLAPGQAVAFTINDAFVKTGTATAITPEGIQLAIKTTGNSANVEIFNPSISTTTTGNTTTRTFVKGNLLKQTVQTATDMYYDIADLAKDGKTIVIYNPGTSGIISITNIKFTFKEAASVKVETTPDKDGTEKLSEVSVASISEEGAVFALRSLRAYTVTEVTETEPTEPEVTEPETTVPEETEPEVTEPETTVPEVTEPETTVPEETEPEVTEPETTVPEETEPEETEPEVTEPETTEPEETEPNEQEQVKEIIKEVGKIIKKLFGWLFG